VTFKEAVEQTANLAGTWEKGLEALRAEDKPHIKAEDTRKLTGSADVDKALREVEPNAHRWDFAIGYQHSNRTKESIYWVEIHTASDSQVSVVLKKLLWLKVWLAGDGVQLAKFERDFVWVSRGTTSFTRTSPQQKQFALLGLQHKGRVLRIPNKRAD